MDTTFRWALVDIQTTGIHIKYDTITEIAVVILTENGIEKTWYRLLAPKYDIPSKIHNGQSFEDIAEELIVLLQGAIFVAHNARFDFGFLKNAFKSREITYQSPMLCTIKLFKALYPLKEEFTLSALALEFGIKSTESHRVLIDVTTLYQIIQRSFIEHSVGHVLKVAKHIYKHSSLPSKLKTDIHTLPETSGVYLFFSSQSKVPLYIGKSVNLRQRIFSHFQNDYLTNKEFILSQQVERIEVISTTGELSALLLESHLIKEHMPIYNRRLRRKKEVVGFKLNKQTSYVTVSISREKEENKPNSSLLGTFSSIHAAKVALLEIIKEFELCLKLSGMETGTAACFNFQLKRCKGACIRREPAEIYNKRVEEAFQQYQIKTWPFSKAIAIKEYCSIQNRTQFLIFNQWRFIGSVEQEEELKSWQLLEDTRIMYHDTYKILYSFFNAKQPPIIDLSTPG